MKKVLIVIIIMVVLASAAFIGGVCSAQAQPNNVMQKDAAAMVRSLTYIKDNKTNLCFAVINSFSRSAVTTVPCHKVSYIEIN